MKTIVAIILMGFFWISFSEAQAGRHGGGEAEVGDVQGNDNGPYLNQEKQSPSTKQDEIEKARLKALDEKLRKAEEAGNRPSVGSTETGSDSSTPGNTGGAKP